MSSTQRKSYTAAFKLSVVEKAIEIGNRAAAKKFQVDERCVRRWRSEQNELEKMPKNRSSRRSGVVAWPVLEDNLEKWVIEQREKGLSVSTVNMRIQAKIIAQQMGIGNFVGGPNWCFRFMRRKKLSVKNKTTDVPILPNDRPDKKTAFLEYTSKIIEEHNLNRGQIINMDEVPVTFDCPPSRTLQSTSEDITTENEKISFTCILSCAANGEKLIPLIIFKQKTVPKGDYPKGVIICASEKGCMCEEMMWFWLREIYQKWKDVFSQSQGLIVLDSGQSHLVDKVKSEAKKLRTDLSVIPDGLTKILHPLVTINGIFNLELRKQWEEWMRSGFNSSKNSERTRKSSYEEVALWVDKAWQSIPAEMIVSAFIKSEIIRKENDSDNSIKSEVIKKENEDSNISTRIKSETISKENEDCTISSFIKSETIRKGNKDNNVESSDLEYSNESDTYNDLLNLFHSDHDESDFEGLV